MARAFGLGEPTGLDLPGEASGRIPDRQWKYEYWKARRAYNCAMAKDGYRELARTDPQRAAYLTALAKENCSPQGYVYRAGDAANFAIGQGDVTVTPLQLARAYAAVANGGTLYVPTIGKAVIRPDGTLVRTIPPKVAGKLPIPQSTLRWMQRAFTRVTEPGGTGYAPFANAGFPLDEIKVATKTGTAEVYGKQSTSWFASWAPAGGAKPQYVVVMMVSQGGTGSGVSGPGVEKIYETLFGVSAGRVDLRRAAPPYGRPVSALPRITRDGDILPPVVSR
jgi:penicillin-binding protein 2